MSFLSKHTSDVRTAVLIELGSGSACVSAVVSDPTKMEPTVLWSKRETAALKNINKLEESGKAVVTALMNILLDFETNGRKALREAGAGKIESVQCTIAAPWAHTVAKRIEYRQEEAFEVSQDLIDELVETASRKARDSEHEQALRDNHSLAVTTRATVHVLLNGYRTKHPVKQSCTEMTLLHTTVVAQQFILDAIKELHQKMFARTKLETYSYALALHCVANDIAPQHSNMSLLDVTHECTELSIIRDSELTYVTHAPFGIYAIAREYAAALDVPLAEALGYLKSDADSLLESLSKSKQEELEAIHDAYVARLTELFTQTGDDLVIPRQIILHIDAQYEAFLHELVTTATKRTLRSEPVVVYASSTIFANLEKSDKARIAGSAAAVSMHFFHTGNQCITIEHE